MFESRRGALCGSALLALALVSALPSSATTLIRTSLDELAAGNERVVLGEVTEAVSYWNQDKTFILTDVKFVPTETIKGQPESELTVTLLGGTVGDLTTLIVGGAELIPGRSYLLFLSQAKLPGAGQTLTVRDHCQGAFEVTIKDSELRAVSQANRHPLVPDQSGYVDAPGGGEGFPLNALLQNLRETVKRQEVKR